MTHLPVNKSLRAFVMLLVAMGATSSFAVADQTRRHPNIVFIMADDK